MSEYCCGHPWTITTIEERGFAKRGDILQYALLEIS